MSIESPQDLHGMRQAGAVTRAVIETMKSLVRPGITTAELDSAGARTMRQFGGRSAPQSVYGFPGQNCISVNDEVVHGIPSKRILREGDIVKLDVTIEVDGYIADACETVPVGRIDAESRRLIDCAEQAFRNGCAAARPGATTSDIGRAIQGTVHRAGFSVIRDLSGHGIGRTIHEPPVIPNMPDKHCSDVLTPGMVFTIEPMIAVGSGRNVTLRDGWTVRTRDRSRSAHYEHTVVLTEDGAHLLTA